MNEPTIDERLDLWRYAYSRASFIEARETALILLKVQEAVTPDHRVALLTALAVTYARPFTVAQITSDRRIIPMRDVLVPSEHDDLHKTYLEMRHQVFGHKDATGPDTGHGVFNQVRFIFKDGNLDLHTVKAGYYASEQLRETVVLADKLIATLGSKLDDVMIKCPVPLEGEGLYILNMDDPTRPWVVKE